MIKIGIAPDNRDFVCQTITPKYMGIGVGASGKNNEWNAAILIEFAEKDRNQVYPLLLKLEEQMTLPVARINIPGESVVIFQALVESKEDVADLLEEEIPFDKDFHLYLSSGIEYEQKRLDHENFFELLNTEGFYLINIIERKDTETHLMKILFTFKMSEES